MEEQPLPLLQVIVDDLKNVSPRQLEQTAEYIKNLQQLAKASSEVTFPPLTAADLGERRSIEAALRTSERRFRDLTDALPNLVWQLSPEGKTTYVNTRWREYFGREAIATYEERAELIHPEDMPGVRNIWYDAAGCDIVGPWEVRYRRHDGVYRWFSTRGRAVCDDKGKHLFWIGTATDIDDLKKADVALRDSSNRLSLALDAAMIGVWDYHLLSGSLTWDARCKAAFGLPADAPVTYDTFLAGLHPEDCERLKLLVQSTISSEGDDRLVADFRTVGLSDGVLRHIHSKGHAFFEQSGDARRAVRFIGTVQDITKRKQSEEALRRANLDLQQFAYAAAHDLQEPLRNVATSMGLLKRNYRANFDESALLLIDTGIDGAKLMHRMVTDLLAFTRVTQDSGEVKTPVDAHQVLDGALRALSNLIRKSEAEISIASPLPPVFVQEVHLLQLFQNTISNAIKYRRRDFPLQIRIGAVQQNAEWLFSVADNGIGFDPKHSAKIFGVFKRLHHRHEYPGTGIGLAICSRIVQSYGGRIWAESTPGEGATIFFSLPAEQDGAKRSA